MHYYNYCIQSLQADGNFNKLNPIHRFDKTIKNDHTPTSYSIIIIIILL